LDSDKWIEAFTEVSALEKFCVKSFEEALEEVHDEAVKNTLKHLAKLSEIRLWMASLYTDGVNLQQDIAIEPILEKIAEEKEFINKMK